MFKIQLNTDKNISGNERFENYLDALIKDKLSHFTEEITKIEVYLTDGNAAKPGENDKRCMLEVRLKFRKPIAVTSYASTVEKAVTDALDKAHASIESVYGRIKHHPFT